MSDTESTSDWGDQEDQLPKFPKSGITKFLKYDNSKGYLNVKVICLGDSAVGKSKLLERFLINSYSTEQHSTFALTLYRYETKVDDEDVIVEFWDTAGQEKFNTLHPSYYHEAQACILVFDSTRKITYKNLNTWYEELRNFRPEIPCFCCANKIDENPEVTKKPFAFAEKNNIPLYFVSGATGVNVAQVFEDAIRAAVNYKKNPTDFTDQILTELENVSIANGDETPENGDNCKKTEAISKPAVLYNGVEVDDYDDDWPTSSSDSY